MPTPDPGNCTAEQARIIAADLLQSADDLLGRGPAAAREEVQACGDAVVTSVTRF